LRQFWGALETKWVQWRGDHSEETLDAQFEETMLA
jgi:hypothetical protein